MKAIVLLSLIIFVLSPGYSIDNAQLLEQVDRNLNPESYESYRNSIEKK